MWRPLFVVGTVALLGLIMLLASGERPSTSALPPGQPQVVAHCGTRALALVAPFGEPHKAPVLTEYAKLTMHVSERALSDAERLNGVRRILFVVLDAPAERTFVGGKWTPWQQRFGFPVSMAWATETEKGITWTTGTTLTDPDCAQVPEG